MIKVEQPEATLLVIERDPARAPNEAILRFLREKARVQARIDE